MRSTQPWPALARGSPSGNDGILPTLEGPKERRGLGQAKAAQPRPGSPCRRYDPVPQLGGRSVRGVVVTSSVPLDLPSVVYSRLIFDRDA